MPDAQNAQNLLLNINNGVDGEGRTTVETALVPKDTLTASAVKRPSMLAYDVCSDRNMFGRRDWNLQQWRRRVSASSKQQAALNAPPTRLDSSTRS